MICAKHPKYRGIRRPKVTCDACWTRWLLATNTLLFVRKAALSSTGKMAIRAITTAKLGQRG